MFAYSAMTSLDYGGTTAAFKQNQGLFVRYAVKLRPQTLGWYKFRVYVTESFSICKMKLVNIGKAFPSLQSNSNSITYSSNGDTETTAEFQVSR